MTSTRPSGPTAIASQPRLPGASVPGTVAAALNVCPPSSDRDCRRVVPFFPFVVQTMTMTGSALARCTSATCGGCSPFRRASPIVSLTRRGAPNVRPASRLTARNTSVVPSGSAPPQATATNAPSAAIDGVAFVRPAVPSVAGGAAWPGIVESNRQKAAGHIDGDHPNDRITPPKDRNRQEPWRRATVRLCGLYELRDQTSSVGVTREAVEIRGRARGGWRTARSAERSYRNRKCLPPTSVAKEWRGRQPARSGPHPTARRRYASCTSSHLLWCGASDKSARAASRDSTCRWDPRRAHPCNRTRAGRRQYSRPGTPASRKPSTQDAGGRRTWTRQLTMAIRRYDGTHPRAESGNPIFRKHRRLSRCAWGHRVRAAAPAPG